MSQWKFQLLPNEPGVIHVGYRMDAIGQKIEDEVNDALRYPLGFHGVNKIVLCLGQTATFEGNYVELGGVGQKQYDDFDASEYRGMSDDEKAKKIKGVVLETFDWFEDAEFVKTGRKNLGWPA